MVCVHIGIGVTKIISCAFTFVLKHKNYSLIGQYTIQDPVAVGPEIIRVTVRTFKISRYVRPDMSACHKGTKLGS